MQFGSDIDDATMKALSSGALLTEALKQGRYSPVDDSLQALLIFAVSEGFADSLSPADMAQFEEMLYRYFKYERKELLEKLETGKKLDSETKSELLAALKEFKAGL